TEVAGLTWRRNGRTVTNDNRPLEDINETPPMPYSLIPVSAYAGKSGELNYLSSRGCPGSCEFCAVKCVHREQWTGLAPERMLRELGELVARHGIRHVHFTDTDFFADIQRVEEFCRLKIDRALPLTWGALGRVANLHGRPTAFFHLIEKAGCRFLEAGGESGSARILSMYHKEITPSDLETFTEKLSGTGIDLMMNWMLGPPGETRGELYVTYEVARRLRCIMPRIRYLFYRFTPIPGSAMGEAAISRGVARPGTPMELPEYAFYVRDPGMPWLSRWQERRVKRAFYYYFPLVFREPRACEPVLKWGVIRMLRKIAVLRLAIHCLALPVDWWLYWLCTRLGLLAKGRLYAWR
ncbi:radical SAM protein, partial [bacterium]|nr:radical SAM protein [candidate division CSSED10-310 bacterium]